MNNPPIAPRVVKSSPPSVQAKAAAKTGSVAKINDTRNGEVCRCANIWITNAERVGKSARKMIVHQVLEVVTANDLPVTAVTRRLPIPISRNC
jgi:hypothetical protein